MTIQHIGYIGMGWAAVMAAAVTDNLAIAGGVLLILVAISTLMIRLASSIEKAARGVIHEMQADGELPTMLERQEMQRALLALTEKLADMLED